MKPWSKFWKKSKNPRKKRKYAARAPLHIKQKMMGTHLSKPLRERYNTRTIGIKVGDIVKVVRGDLKNKRAKVIKCDLKKGIIHLENVQVTKRDGTKVNIPIKPSNVIIMELTLEDKIRKKILERKGKNGKTLEKT